MRVLTDPVETGAVTLSLPQDVQAHAYDYPIAFFEKKIWRIDRQIPSPERIKEAVSLLKEAKRPMLIAGGGIHYSEAWESLKNFSEELGIPVGETFAGKGALRQESALGLGGFGVTGNPCAGEIANQSDLLISVGTRLTDFSTGSQSAFNHPGVNFISINVCSHDAYKQGAIPILADARKGLDTLLQAARSSGVKSSSSYVKEISSVKQKWQNQVNNEIFQQVSGEAMSQGQLIGVLNEEAKEGDTIVAAAGNPPGDLLKLWEATGGRNCHLEFGNSCMGYEIPAGLGVRMAQPDGEVYVFVGDGTYLMNPMELLTAVQENLKITVVISENHGYQCIRSLQVAKAGHSFGNEFRARQNETNRLEADFLQIDFAHNAQSLGAKACHVYTPGEFREALREARKNHQTCVIVVETEKYRMLPGSGVWWDVAVAEVSNDPEIQKRREEYETERRKLQKFHY